MTNANETAYPVEFLMQSGLTKREYFAAHAPKMPKWFTSQKPWPTIPKPEMPDGLTTAEVAEIVAWHKDPIYDLPEQFKDYQQAICDWWEAKRQQQIQKDYSAQWESPWYYADNVIKAANE